MPKPRRRRRFFALEGRFEVDDTGEMQGLAEPALRTDPPVSPDLAATNLAAFDAAPDQEEPLDDSLPPAFRLNRLPRTHASPAPQRVLSVASLLLAAVCMSAGLLVGFLWPRTVPKPTVAEPLGNVPKEPEALSAADQEDLDAAYAARHARDFDAAARLFAELERRHPDWGPVRVETGRTLFYAGQPADATHLLRHAVEKGWKPAEANFLLAMLAKGGKAYEEAESRFASAVAIDPTAPDYYFFWGECLREQGKLLNATAKFRSAYLRNQYETATGLYHVKLWLCAIEADQADHGVNAEIDADLASSQPSMEAFVAAAARDLKAGDLHATEAHLSAARQRADVVVFHYIISDPLFAELRTKPQFAGMFGLTPPAASPEAGSPTPAISR